MTPSMSLKFSSKYQIVETHGCIWQELRCIWQELCCIWQQTLLHLATTSLHLAATLLHFGKNFAALGNFHRCRRVDEIRLPKLVGV